VVAAGSGDGAVGDVVDLGGLDDGAGCVGAADDIDGCGAGGFAAGEALEAAGGGEVGEFREEEGEAFFGDGAGDGGSEAVVAGPSESEVVAGSSMDIEVVGLGKTAGSRLVAGMMSWS